MRKEHSGLMASFTAPLGNLLVPLGPLLPCALYLIPYMYVCMYVCMGFYDPSAPAQDLKQAQRGVCDAE